MFHITQENFRKIPKMKKGKKKKKEKEILYFKH